MNYGLNENRLLLTDERRPIFGLERITLQGSELIIDCDYGASSIERYTSVRYALVTPPRNRAESEC